MQEFQEFETEEIQREFKLMPEAEPVNPKLTYSSL